MENTAVQVSFKRNELQSIYSIVSEEWLCKLGLIKIYWEDEKPQTRLRQNSITLVSKCFSFQSK